MRQLQATLSRFVAALGDSLQWRLLLSWAALLLIPTTIAAVPLWRTLAAATAHSVHAPDLARHLDLLLLSDIGVHIGMRLDAFDGVLRLTLLAMVLVTPLATGMMVTAAQAQRPLGFVALWRGGCAEYWRMVRMMLVALIPYLIIVVLAVAVGIDVGKLTENATSQSKADGARLLVTLVTLMLFIVAHATVEMGRAVLAADAQRRSAFRAWTEGARLYFRRPLQTLALYLGISTVSLLATLALTLLRARVVPASFLGFIGAFALTQLLVAAIGWGRAGRLFALVALVRAQTTPSATPSAAPSTHSQLGT